MQTTVLQKACGAKDVQVHTTSGLGWRQLLQLETLLDGAYRIGAAAPEVQASMLDYARQVRRSVRAVELAECPFDGEVDVEVSREREWWVCPVCRTEHDDPTDRQ